MNSQQPQETGVFKVTQIWLKKKGGNILKPTVKKSQQNVLVAINIYVFHVLLYYTNRLLLSKLLLYTRIITIICLLVLLYCSFL